MIDFDAINAAALQHAESLCMELLPGGSVRRNEYETSGINGGNGHSLKVNLETGIWTDFGGNEGGVGMVSLVAACKNLRNSVAAEWLSQKLSLGIASVKAPKASKKGKKSASKATSWHRLTTPVPTPKLPTHFRGNKIVRWDEYHNENGTSAGFACRAEWQEDGKTKKDVVPLIWAQNADGKQEWRFQEMPEPRPLFGLHYLHANPESPVLVVEGEKTAEAARKLLEGTEWLVTCWAGGCGAVKSTSFLPLLGRKVVYWPDNDDAGLKAAQDFAKIVSPCKIVTIPEGTAPKWDLADALEEGWTQEDVLGFLTTDCIIPQETDEEEDVPPDNGTLYAEKPPFRYLGFYGKPVEFYFISETFGQVVSFTAPYLVESNLITIAPPEYWRKHFPNRDEDGKAKGGVNWNEARANLIWKSSEQGMFNPDNIRGVGCWMEGESLVIHTGSELVRDGKKVPLNSSVYIYERASPIEDEIEIPALLNAESAKFLSLCRSISFSDPMAGTLLAGWCYAASICPVFSWRSHLWLVGGAGSGKSTVCSLASKAVGGYGVYGKGGTTSAALQRRIGMTGKCVLLDDMESDNEKKAARNDDIIEMARQCSTKSGSAIYKGTVGKETLSFSSSSMFFFDSISTPHLEPADASRITVIEKLLSDTESWETTQKLMNEIDDPVYWYRLRLRARTNAKTIASNARVFAKAMAKTLGTERAGDQYGTMLAGAFGLTSTNAITYEQAVEWIAKKDWVEAKVKQDEKEENLCLRRLLDCQFEFIGPPRINMPVWEIVKRMFCLFNGQQQESEEYDILESLLIRNGLMWKPTGHLYVSACHPSLQKAFQGSRWGAAKSWTQSLARLPCDEKPGLARIRTHGFKGEIRRAVKINYIPQKNTETE